MLNVNWDLILAAVIVLLFGIIVLWIAVNVSLRWPLTTNWLDRWVAYPIIRITVVALIVTLTAAVAL